MEGAFGPTYEAYAVAELNGVAFEVTPAEAKWKALDQDTITWEWNILPKASGRQIVNVQINVRWQSLNGEGLPIERTVWHAPLKVEVKEPWLATGQINVLTIVSGAIGSILSATTGYALYDRVKKAKAERQNAEKDKPRIYLPGDEE